MSEDLARRLRQIRETGGRSLRDLERSLHVSSSSLSRYLTGQAVPPWSVVVGLCQVAGVDPRPLRPLWEAGKRGPRVGPAVTVTRNDLPYDISTFTGRQEELAAVLTAARAERVVAIDGMGGVGKTTLAVHAAHRLNSDYPDAQLYLDLHGFTPGRDPVEPGEALRILLAALGVPSGRIPEAVEERAALWRSELAMRRAVVVLDNVAGQAQVRPLLPGAGSSIVLITSRRRLVGLGDAHPVTLDVLGPREAADLVGAALGDARAQDSPALEEVLRRCGHLPLVLGVAAARMRHRPAWTLETLAEYLREGDLGTAGVLSMSLRDLDDGQHRMFRLLGLAPGVDLSVHAAAALAEVPVSTARRLLDDLVDASLVLENVPGRYHQHDLLRELARGAAEERDEKRGALTRLLDHYVRAAATATNLLYPSGAHLRPAVPAGEPFARPADALRWLDGERANLVTAGTYAAEHGWPEHAVLLARTLYPYLDGHAHHAESLPLYGSALEAARHLGDRGGEVHLLNERMSMNARQGRYDHAHDDAKHARDLAREIGDRYGEARALNALGDMHWRERDDLRAEERFHAALELFREVDAGTDVAIVLGNLGLVAGRQGRYDEAERALRQALAGFAAIGLPGGQGTIRANLGQICLWRGRPAEALEHYRQALEHHRGLDYPSGEADALNGMGTAARHLGEMTQAVEDHRAALAMAVEAGDPARQAAAHEGLARAHRERGERDLAREHATGALDVYVRMGLPEADDMRAFLAG